MARPYKAVSQWPHSITGAMKYSDPQMPRYNCVVRQTLHYSSGRVALQQGQRVVMQESVNTCWVYDAAGVLLYTFNKPAHGREYLRLERKDEKDEEAKAVD